MREVTTVEIVEAILGRTYPIGESGADDVRYENLKEKIELVKYLIGDLVYMSEYSTAGEYSVKRAGKAAKMALAEIREALSDES